MRQVAIVVLALDAVATSDADAICSGWLNDGGELGTAWSRLSGEADQDMGDAARARITLVQIRPVTFNRISWRTTHAPAPPPFSDAGEPLSSISSIAPAVWRRQRWLCVDFRLNQEPSAPRAGPETGKEPPDRIAHSQERRERIHELREYHARTMREDWRYSRNNPESLSTLWRETHSA